MQYLQFCVVCHIYLFCCRLLALGLPSHGLPMSQKTRRELSADATWPRVHPEYSDTFIDEWTKSHKTLPAEHICSWECSTDARCWFTWGRVFHWGRSRGPGRGRGRQDALGSLNMPGPRGSRWSYICHIVFHHQAVTQKLPFLLPLYPERWHHGTKHSQSAIKKRVY